MEKLKKFGVTVLICLVMLFVPIQISANALWMPVEGAEVQIIVEDVNSEITDEVITLSNNMFTKRYSISEKYNCTEPVTGDKFVLTVKISGSVTYNTVTGEIETYINDNEYLISDPKYKVDHIEDVQSSLSANRATIYFGGYVVVTSKTNLVGWVDFSLSYTPAAE